MIFPTNFFSDIIAIIPTLFNFIVHLINEVKFYKSRYEMAQFTVEKLQFRLKLMEKSRDYFSSQVETLESANQNLISNYETLVNLHSTLRSRYEENEENHRLGQLELIAKSFMEYTDDKLDLIDDHASYYVKDLTTIESLIDCLVDLAVDFDELKDDNYRLTMEYEEIEEKLESAEYRISEYAARVAAMENDSISENEPDTDNGIVINDYQSHFDGYDLILAYRDPLGCTHKLTIREGNVCYSINGSYEHGENNAMMPLSSYKLIQNVCKWYVNLRAKRNPAFKLTCDPNSTNKRKLYKRFGWQGFDYGYLTLSPNR